MSVDIKKLSKRREIYISKMLHCKEALEDAFKKTPQGELFSKTSEISKELDRFNKEFSEAFRALKMFNEVIVHRLLVAGLYKERVTRNLYNNSSLKQKVKLKKNCIN